MVMHLYCNYSMSKGDSDRFWRHSHYCWCRRESGKRVSLDSQKLDMMDYAYFDVAEPVRERFPVEEPEKRYKVTADIRVEKDMTFYVTARTSKDALDKGQAYIDRMHYPNDVNIMYISVKESE